MKTREEQRFQLAEQIASAFVGSHLGKMEEFCEGRGITVPQHLAQISTACADALLAELDKTAPKPETPVMAECEKCKLPTMHSGRPICYSCAQKEPDADGWIPHRPGDAMPCDGGMMVLVKLRNGNTWDVPDRADWWADDSEMSDCWRSENSSAAIIAWKPA